MATTEKVKVIKIDTEPGTTSVKALRDELRQLKETLLNVEEGTEEYNKAIQRAGDIQHQLKEQMEEINASAMDFGQIVGNATKAASGLAAGFQSVQAVMTLFGKESEDVTKAIQKMQAIMALTQGIAGIDNGIKAFKRLSLVLKNGTPVAKAFSVALQPKSILLLTTAVTALIAIWDKFGDSIEKALPFITKIKDAFNDTKKAAEEAAKAQEDYLSQVAAAEDKLADFQLQQKINKLNSESKKSYDELSTAIEGYKLEIEEIVLKQKKEGISREEWTELNERGLEVHKQLSAALKQQKAILNDETSYIEKNTKAKKENAEADEKAKEVKDTFFEDAYAEIEYNKAINKDYAESKVALEDLLYVQELQLETLEEGSAAWYNLGVRIEETKQKIADFGKVEPEVEPEPVELSAEDAELQREAIRYAAIEESYELHLMNMQSKLDEALAKNLISETTYEKASEKLIKKKADFQVKSTAAAFNMAASILSSFAEMEDENDKEGFERSKKLQIASATMQMISGIVTALSGAFTTKSGPWDIALAAIQSATIAASTAAQIAKIQKMTFGGSGNVSTSTPSASAVSTLSAPVQYTSDVNSASIEQSIKDTRVYVTESDITNTQRKVDVIEHENRF